MSLLPFIYFLNCILLIMVLQLSQFSLFVPLYPAPPTPSGSTHSIVHVHGSCVWVLWLLHFLYCTSHPHGYSVTTYFYFLIPSPLHPFPYTPLPSGNHLITNFFSLGASESLSISLIFGLLMMMCLGVGLLASFLSGTLYFLDLHVYFLHEIREVFFHYFSNRLPISCSFSSPSGTPMMWMLDLLNLFQRLLTLSSSFLDSFFFLFFCMVVFCFLMFQIIDVILSFIRFIVVSL